MVIIMGNTSSTAKHPHSLPLDSPARSHSRRSRSTAPQTPASPAGAAAAARTASPSPRSPSVAPPPSPAPDAQQQGTASSTGQQSQSSTAKQKLPHRSLRTKKKSLELPDLALALTSSSSTTPSSHANPAAGPSGASAAAGQASAVSGPYRRPQASSPIAIPATPNGIPLLPGEQQDRLPTIPTNVVNAAQQLPMAEAIVQTPPAPPAGRGRAVNHHMRGAPLQYNSTRSFAGAYATATGQQGQQQQQQPPSFAARSQQQPHAGFVPEDIHSSIPLALRNPRPVRTAAHGRCPSVDDVCARPPPA